MKRTILALVSAVFGLGLMASTAFAQQTDETANERGKNDCRRFQLGTLGNVRYPADQREDSD